MDYYILKNKKMPWGDYGNVLFAGFLNVLDKNYNDLEVPELERTGAYIPDIYITNSINIVATDKIKKLIELSPVSGIVRFQKIIKKKTVDIDWENWDLNAKEPLFYPKSKSPENYIIKNKHSDEIAAKMPDVWSVVFVHCLNPQI